jgi:FixJ family two-component response regulator
VRRTAGIVFVVDDDASIREALASLLRSSGLGVRCFASAQDFLRHDRTDLPACLVLDVRMPDGSGLDLQHAVRASAEPLPIIFITGYGDIRMAVKAMKEGAVEFLPKPFREQELLDAVRRALELNLMARARRADLLSLRSRHNHLSDRERAVLARLAQGKLNKQIAAELGISEVTVKAHRRRVMEKMEASSFAELVLMSERLQQNRAVDQCASS